MAGHCPGVRRIAAVTFGIRQEYVIIGVASVILLRSQSPQDADDACTRARFVGCLGRPGHNGCTCPSPNNHWRAALILATVNTMRSISNFELFVLALIDRGCRTPYDLDQRAGVSIGGSSPALARLSERSLISAGKKGPRGRREYNLTSTGERVLDENLSGLTADSVIPDFDSLARSLVMLWTTRRRRLALQLLQNWSKPAPSQKQPERRASLPRQPDAAQLYRWIQHVRNSHRTQAESKAAEQVLRTLTRVHRGAKSRR